MRHDNARDASLPASAIHGDLREKASAGKEIPAVSAFLSLLSKRKLALMRVRRGEEEKMDSPLSRNNTSPPKENI